MRRPTLAALLLLPLLAACGGGGGGGQHTEAAGSAGSAPRAAASAEPSPSPSGTPSSGPSTGSSGRAPSSQGPKNTVPDDELTPVTGSFTKKEKTYLSGRVPEGTDPAAILQAGQETCDRLAATAKIDRDATVGAIIAGEVKGAEEAVKGLCPELKSLIEDTEGGYADGTHTDPVPGTYRALTPMKDCSWSLDGAAGGKHRITIKKGTKSFTSSGCYAWQKES
ncbi:hypothetical protein ADK57_34190 [Streptomyces sp. MMG1533]|uniref:hypothetical protein n=1 Tax=Streptomyces sp. MMG1533 TaxID=1415546 RepID=UPI0006ADC4B3|nr:hypothetical protein [Streptomyces sp. MMG1533]KOU59252.1 hypothetical protein ADK57_34190 [Streptomyces sp. MMG1533]